MLLSPNYNQLISGFAGANKVKKKADLLKYDVVLTTYSVRTPFSGVHHDSLTARQTMALQWPDYEKDEAKSKKAKAKKPANDFIASDSDDSDSDRPKAKKEREYRRPSFSPPNHSMVATCDRRSAVPSRCMFLAWFLLDTPHVAL